MELTRRSPTITRDAGVTYTTGSAPAYSGYIFTQWSISTAQTFVNRDAFGTAFDSVNYTLYEETVLTAEYVSAAKDEDADGVADGHELYWYGRMDVTADTNTDGDAYAFSEELQQGTSPHAYDTHISAPVVENGTVAYGDSALVEMNLQPFKQVQGALVDSEFTSFFTSPLAGNEDESLTFGTDLSPGVADWNGDGLFDLFLASSGELRIYTNCGGTGNPDLTLATNGVCTALQSAVASMAHPMLAGDGINGLYLCDNGGVISRYDFLSDAFTATSLSGAPAVLDGTLVALQPDGTLACADANTALLLDTPVVNGLSISSADVDADGPIDLLASDGDGRIWFYKRTGDSAFTLQHKVWGGSRNGFAAGLRLAAVDWEDDGDIDALGGTAEGKLMLLRDPRVGRPTNIQAYAGMTSVGLTSSRAELIATVPTPPRIGAPPEPGSAAARGWGIGGYGSPWGRPPVFHAVQSVHSTRKLSSKLPHVITFRVSCR